MLFTRKYQGPCPANSVQCYPIKARYTPRSRAQGTLLLVLLGVLLLVFYTVPFKMSVSLCGGGGQFVAPFCVTVTQDNGTHGLCIRM